MCLLHDKVFEGDNLLLVLCRETLFTQRRTTISILLVLSAYLSDVSVFAVLMNPDFADERDGVIFQNPAGVFWRAADFAKDRVFRDSWDERLYMLVGGLTGSETDERIDASSSSSTSHCSNGRRLGYMIHQTSGWGSLRAAAATNPAAPANQQSTCVGRIDSP
jgi:hypothetical protein